MRRSAIAGLFVTLVGASGAHAATLYNNNTTNIYNGDCSFSTTCAVGAGRGDDYAAQMFDLGKDAKLTSASFAELDYGTGPSAVNWFISTVSGNLPGATLFSGLSTVTKMSTIGSAFGLTLSQVDFDLSGVKLGAGSYFFALQAISPTFYTYLANGVSEGGAAETHDGGATWARGYESIGSVGIALSGTSVSAVPLPASAPMFGAALLALGGLGYGVKRRKAAAAQASA